MLTSLRTHKHLKPMALHFALTGIRCTDGEPQQAIKPGTETVKRNDKTQNKGNWRPRLTTHFPCFITANNCMVAVGGSYEQWASPVADLDASGVARTLPMLGHSMGTLHLWDFLCKTRKQLRRSGGCSPRNFLNF